jgi:hypothetical protein
LQGAATGYLFRDASKLSDVQVEQQNLWERVAETMGFTIPEPLPGSTKSAMSSLKYQLREKAFRYLVWIENDAPADRVLGLQSAARLAPLPLEPRSPAVAAVPGLRGGFLSDSVPTYSAVASEAWVWPFDSDQKDAGEKRRREESSMPAETSAGAMPAAEPEEGAAGAETDAKRRRLAEGGEFKGEPSSSAQLVPVPLPSPPAPVGPVLPVYIKRLPVQVGWEQDAARLYCIHDHVDQLAGAVCAHMNVSDVCEEEESAFPMCSKVAHASTSYPDLHRREVVRTNIQVYFIPSPCITSQRETIMAYDDLRYEGDSDMNIQVRVRCSSSA